MADDDVVDFHRLQRGHGVEHGFVALLPPRMSRPGSEITSASIRFAAISNDIDVRVDGS